MRSDVPLAMLIIFGDPTGVLLQRRDAMHAELRMGLNESVLESLAARYRTYLEELTRLVAVEPSNKRLDAAPDWSMDGKLHRLRGP